MPPWHRCLALPGNFLLLRRQSMMGDALSHAVLLGVVMAFLAAQLFKGLGWISSASLASWTQSFYFLGAIIIGVLCSLLTEWFGNSVEWRVRHRWESSLLLCLLWAWCCCGRG
ncbi:MAG: metal ABC transporter permease [Planctomycetaceae bacterium]